MISINIPGYKQLVLEALVLDYNGTLAKDGILPVCVQDHLKTLAKQLEIHIITADTFGSVSAQCKNLPVIVKVLTSNNHTQEKADYLDIFGERMVVAIGNGANDRLMLKKAQLGIVVIGEEGCSGASLMAADVVVKDICDALEMLINPQRLIATLRN